MMINLFKKKAKPITINLKKDTFYINDVAVGFPTSTTILYQLLGKPSRSGKTEKTRSPIDCWDDFGIYANYSTATHIFSILLITGKHEALQIHPKSPFSGDVLVEEKPFNQLGKPEIEFGPHRIRQMVKEGKELGYNIGWNPNYKVESPKEYYTVKMPDEEVIRFKDFGFKLAIIQELMYNNELLKPKFDLYEFVEWYDKRKIDIDKEGYNPIPEVTQYFKDLPIPKRLAPEITEIYQDGGNDVYLQLLRFGEGWEDYWDIESTEDVKQFPNLKKVVLCYAKENVLDELIKLGIEAKWI